MVLENKSCLPHSSQGILKTVLHSWGLDLSGHSMGMVGCEESLAQGIWAVSGCQRTSPSHQLGQMVATFWAPALNVELVLEQSGSAEPAWFFWFCLEYGR